MSTCSGCPPVVDDSDNFDECVSGIIRYKSACCFTVNELVVNIICALKDIAAAIREYIASQPVVVATGVMQFNIKDYGSLTNGNCVDVELFRAGFDLEIVGIWASVLDPLTPAGVYSTDDKLKISLRNEDTNVQIGNTLIIKATQDHDEQASGGEVIGQNIAVGNRAMLRICYEDTEGSTFPAKEFDFFLLFVRYSYRHRNKFIRLDSMIVKTQQHKKDSVAVVVTTYSGYIGYLSKVLKSVLSQTVRFDEFILVLDGVQQEKDPNGWNTIRANFANPNKSRNAGIEAIKRSNWVVFWDGDNIMSPTFLEDHINTMKESGARNIGFFYPSISYRNQFEDSREVRKLEVPEYNYWKFRERTFVDTSSLWRIEAINGVGGFDPKQPKFDDWDLSLRITANGWSAKKSRAVSHITIHDVRRSNNGLDAEAIWNCRTLGIVTLWSGQSECHSELLDWYESCDVPPKTSLYWLNNSGDPDFTEYLWAYARNLCDKFKSIKIIDYGQPYIIKASHKELERHQYVANLYNKIIPSVIEDLVLFVEDDNLPAKGDIRTLSDNLLINSRVACVGAAYRSKNHPNICCASRHLDEWINCPKFNDIPPEPFRVGMIGGGFTLYLNSALKKALPMSCILHTRSNALIGWDGNIGRCFTEMGYELRLHGGVKVEHRCKEVVDFLKNREEFFEKRAALQNA